MKPVNLTHISQNKRDYTEIQEKLSLCLAEEHNHPDPEIMLAEIRAGDAKSIERLLLSSQTLIYRMMLKQPESAHTVKQRFNFAYEKLTQLAMKELNSKNRPCFLRFEAWVIRQALLQLENKV